LEPRVVVADVTEPAGFSGEYDSPLVGCSTLTSTHGSGWKH